MSFSDVSLFQNIIFALIGFLNPWPSLDNDTKAAFIEKSLNASIQIIRSYNIETVYKELEIDTRRDLVSLKGLQFKYYMTTENEMCSVDDMATVAYEKFEDYFGCPINVSLDSLDFSGLLSIDKKKFKQKVVLNNLHIDTSFLDNSPETKAMKKLLDVTDNITIYLEYDSEYFFNLNELSFNFIFDVEDFVKFDIKSSANRLHFPFSFDDAQENFRITMQKFSTTLTDKGLVEKINLISEINNQPTLDQNFLELIGMNEEQLKSDNLTSSSHKIFKQIYTFLKEPGVISCTNSTSVSLQTYDFLNFLDFSNGDENFMTKLCSVVTVN